MEETFRAISDFVGRPFPLAVLCVVGLTVPWFRARAMKRIAQYAMGLPRVYTGKESQVNAYTYAGQSPNAGWWPPEFLLRPAIGRASSFVKWVLSESFPTTKEERVAIQSEARSRGSALLIRVAVCSFIYGLLWAWPVAVGVFWLFGERPYFGVVLALSFIPGVYEFATLCYRTYRESRKMGDHASS